MADIQNVTISDQPVRVTIGAVGPQGPGGGGSTTIDLSMHDLQELRNVSGNPQDDNILLYDATNSQWVPGQFGAGLTVSGTTVSLTNPNTGGGGAIQDYIQSIASTTANNLLTLSFVPVVDGTVQTEATEAIIPLDSIRTLSFNTSTRQIMVETIDARDGTATTVPLANMPALPNYLDIGDPGTTAGDYVLRRNTDGTFSWDIINDVDVRANIPLWNSLIGYEEGDIIRYREADTVPFGTYQRIEGTETTVTNPEDSLLWQRVDGVYLQHNGVAPASLDPTEGPLPALTSRFDKINFTGDGVNSIRYDNVNDCWIVDISGGGTNPTPPTMLMVTSVELLGGPTSTDTVDDGQIPVSFAAREITVRYEVPAMISIARVSTPPVASFNGTDLTEPVQTPATLDNTGNTVSFTWTLTPEQAATVGGMVSFTSAAFVVTMPDGSIGTGMDSGAPVLTIIDDRTLALSSVGTIDLFSAADLNYTFPTRTNVEFGTGVNTTVSIGPDANNLTPLATQPTVTNAGFTVLNSDIPASTVGDFVVALEVVDTRAAADRTFNFTDTVTVNDNRVAALQNTGSVGRSILSSAEYTNMVTFTNSGFVQGVTVTRTLTPPNNGTPVTAPVTADAISLPGRLFTENGAYTITLTVVDTRATVDRTFTSTQTVNVFTPFFAYDIPASEAFTDIDRGVQADTTAQSIAAMESTNGYPPSGTTRFEPMVPTRTVFIEVEENEFDANSRINTQIVGMAVLSVPFANARQAMPFQVTRQSGSGTTLTYNRYVVVEEVAAAVDVSYT